jgi:hypothetical protein
MMYVSGKLTSGCYDDIWLKSTYFILLRIYLEALQMLFAFIFFNNIYKDNLAYYHTISPRMIFSFVNLF